MTPNSSAKKEYLSWSAIQRAVVELAKGCEGRSIDRIIGVARGGLIPAVLLSHALKVGRVDSVQVVSRHPETGDPVPVMGMGSIPAKAGPGGKEEGTIIIDDIMDSGRTKATMMRLFPQATFLAVVARDGSAPILVGRRAWVVFPWEEAAQGHLALDEETAALPFPATKGYDAAGQPEKAS